MINLFFQNTSVETYWDLSNPIVFWGIILVPMMYFFIGVRLILKYFTTMKRKEFIYFGLTLIFFGCFWWNTFLYFLSLYFSIPESMYYIFTFGMFPIAALLWIYSCFCITTPSYKKPILIISFATFILYEIFFWIALFFAPQLIGDIKGGFYWYPSLFILILITVLVILSASGLFAIAKETLYAKDSNIRWKGRFLLIAFIFFTIGGFFEIIIPFSVLSFVFLRVIIISSSLFFYIGFLKRIEPIEEIQEKSIQEKPDAVEFLKMIAKHKKNPLTEKEITFYKEQKICLVCKTKPLRITYICPDCDAIYCAKCVNALIELENACWVCKSPFDPSKPVHLIEFKEEDIIVETDETKKKLEKSMVKKPF